MKIRLVFGRTGYDYEVSWADIKTVIAEIPEELKDYNLMGGEKLEDGDN